MQSVNRDLMEAVHKLRHSEQEVVDYRKEVANLLVKASSTQPVTGLSMMTGIGRTTIYWLMRVWSDENSNENRNP